MGVSGGAFGTIAALPLVRFYYPDTEILVFNDSGVGVVKDGNPGFINETLLAGWNASSVVPASCTDCTSNGHATGLIEWQLDWFTAMIDGTEVWENLVDEGLE